MLGGIREEQILQFAPGRAWNRVLTNSAHSVFKATLLVEAQEIGHLIRPGSHGVNPFVLR